MNFISWQFLLFLVLTWIVFRVASPKKRMLVLLAASYIFYSAWSLPFLALILVTTSVDYLCAIRISRSDDKEYRKSLLIAGVAVNLLILCCFKYMNFLFASQYSICNYLGFHTQLLHLDLILPLGISFYTF